MEIIRGAPCGATWDAAKRMVGLSPHEAIRRIGLEVQYFCTADPSDWDPIFEKSAVHIAGEHHIAGLKKALKHLDSSSDPRKS